jgi:hypothetical protein
VGKQSLVDTERILEFVATKRVDEESFILLQAMRCSLYASTLTITKHTEIFVVIFSAFWDSGNWVNCLY